MIIDTLKEIISKNSSFIISTHKDCDGDGLGGGLALYYVLKKLGKDVTFIALETPHKKYQFLNEDNIIQVFDKNNFSYKDETVFLIIDTNDPLLVEPLYTEAKKQNMKTYFIDHHPIIHDNRDDTFLINSKASSVAEIIYSFLKKMDIPLDEKIATALFTSIVFDTSQFRITKNSAAPFAISAEITPYMKDINIVYDNLFKNLTIDKLNFFTKVKDIEYHSNKKVAFLYITEKELEEINADINQALDLIDMVRDIASIKSTALVIKNKDGSFKISLRSRDKDLLPLVKKFNGGGHRHSAGAYINDKKLPEIKEAILSHLKY